MEKRFQVFVSSTYDDLRAERAEVMQALLELDCMPAGMELFPAASEEQWNWIARVIEESDYYLVIVGGRYGTRHPQKMLSYTELEYRYAVEIGKPVIAFLHGSPGEIPAGKTEKDPEAYQRLLDFRAYCEQRLCKYWNNASDLGGKVSRSTAQLIKRHPAIGWIRGDSVDAAQRIAILELKEENATLRNRIQSLSGVGPHAELSQGDDQFVLEFWCDTQQPKLNKKGIRYWVSAEGFWQEVSLTWNQLLKGLGGNLLVNVDENEIVRSLNQVCESFLRNNPPITRRRDYCFLRKNITQGC